MDAPCGRWERFWHAPRIKALRGAAGHLFEIAVPAVVAFTSPRAWAFALLGIEEYLNCFPGDREAQRISSALATRLDQNPGGKPVARLGLV